MQRNPSGRVALPPLYPILDAEALARAGISLAVAASSLRDAGITLVQYRDKAAADNQVLAAMRLLRQTFPPGRSTLLLNDRVGLCAAAGADGVHLGQEDMPAREARELLGPRPILGLSTHNEAQLRRALAEGAADYVAIGPVFATTSKQNPDPVVGPEGVARARELTDLPLVAIGGIALERGRSVLDAGADAVALISALLPPPGPTAALSERMTERVRDILLHLR